MATAGVQPSPAARGSHVYRPLAPTSGQAMQSIAVGDAVGASWPATRVEGLCGGVVWRGCMEGLYGGVVSCDNFYLVNI